MKRRSISYLLIVISAAVFLLFFASQLEYRYNEGCFPLAIAERVSLVEDMDVRKSDIHDFKRTTGGASVVCTFTIGSGSSARDGEAIFIKNRLLPFYKLEHMKYQLTSEKPDDMIR
jgi:hypothetical protein